MLLTRQTMHRSWRSINLHQWGSSCLQNQYEHRSHCLGRLVYPYQRSGEPKRSRTRARTPHDNNYQININTFVTELDPMLSSLTNNRDDFLIAGDLNINLLQINVVKKEHYAQFLDLMLAYSLFPKITFPTRTSESGSCTLIDNIFCKLSKETLFSIAGILYTSVSDHYPYFLSFNRSKNRGNEPPSRYVKQRVETESARVAYPSYLMNLNIISQRNQDPYCDPNVNHDILHKHITDLKDKHLPFRLVKFNKYKHKGNKWITNGVLKSFK